MTLKNTPTLNFKYAQVCGWNFLVWPTSLSEGLGEEMCEILWRGSTENQVLLQQRELLRKFFKGNLILLKDLRTRDCALQQLPFLKSFHLNDCALLVTKRKWQPSSWKVNKLLEGTNSVCESKVYSLFFFKVWLSKFLVRNESPRIKEIIRTPECIVFL